MRRATELAATECRRPVPVAFDVGRPANSQAGATLELGAAQQRVPGMGAQRTRTGTECDHDAQAVCRKLSGRHHRHRRRGADGIRRRWQPQRYRSAEPVLPEQRSRRRHYTGPLQLFTGVTVQRTRYQQRQRGYRRTALQSQGAIRRRVHQRTASASECHGRDCCDAGNAGNDRTPNRCDNHRD